MSELENSFAKTNTTTFGLSKDLAIPIQVKIGYLQSTEHNTKLASLSEKFENPQVFKTLSKIHKNSDLFITVAVYDGPNNNRISIAVQTPYKSLVSNKRTWNSHLKLAYNYNQVSIDSYLKFTIYEIQDSRPVVFGLGYLSLFNKTKSELRRGAQKIPIYQNDFKEHVEMGDIPGLTQLEERLIGYENGDYPHIPWLDKISLASIKKQNQTQLNLDHDHYLYVELPNFELPIVYSEVTIDGPEHLFVDDGIGETAAQCVVINSIDIPMNKSFHESSSIQSKASISDNLKVYDPDFQTAFYSNSQNKTVSLDPIELKYHKLERNIHNNSILDKELKPSPQLRDELLKILSKPSNIELNDFEKNLIWKFRYFFSKNNSVGGNDKVLSLGSDSTKTKGSNVTTTKSFFPKFLKSINWNNDYELSHVFEEIIPTYWSVDKLQIGDALELLSSYFNPYTLCPISIQQENGTEELARGEQERSKNGIKAEQTKQHRIFKYVKFLRKHAVDRLKLANNEELLLYLLQLVQALKYESLIYDKKEMASASENFQMVNELNADQDLLKSPLAKFLIEKSVQNDKLGNFFYWYLKVENEDQLSHGANAKSIYTVVLNTFIESLKKYSQAKRLPYYKNLKRQIWFIKKLTSLVELIRSSFKKNEATSKKKEFLKEYLSNSSNELLKFPEPFPLPLDPSIIVCGCYPEESSVFKSSLSPLKITLKTIVPPKSTPSSSQLFGKKQNKYGKYPLMFKIGDDLRQDQLVIQIINLMDQLLKNENLDLRLTPYNILATSPIAGLIQFVPNETLDTILSRTYPGTDASSNGILNYMRSNEHADEQMNSESSISQESSTLENNPVISSDLGVSSVILDNYVKSCAGYCVITYLLGVGDRHLDNLLLSPNGKFWHADFGYILGRDPKPFPPLMKLPIQVIDGMGGLNHENFSIFKSYCFITYTTLRKNSNLILNLFQLMLNANIPDIMIDPKRAIEKVQEKFCLEMTEEEAILHFQNLINDSVNAFLPVVIDRLHSLAQYWRA